MKKLLTSVVLAIALAASPFAEARPGKHVRHVRHHHRHHHVRVVQQPVTDYERNFFFSRSMDIVQDARRYLNSGPIFGRTTLWCARFMNYILKETGHRGTGSDMAASFASYGKAVRPQVGAIAVMHRRGGGHVGVVSGFDNRGNPIIISGNHGNRVREASYDRRRVYKYVMP